MCNLQKFALVTAFVLLASPTIAAGVKKPGAAAKPASQPCNGTGWGGACECIVTPQGISICTIRGVFSAKDGKVLEGVATRAQARAKALSE